MSVSVLPLPPRPRLDEATHRHAWRLVRALEVAFRIDPQDDRLVAAFGEGDEVSNHQALFHWVFREIHRLDDASARALLPHLTHRLTVCLLDWESEPCL